MNLKKKVLKFFAAIPLVTSMSCVGVNGEEKNHLDSDNSCLEYVSDYGLSSYGQMLTANPKIIDTIRFCSLPEGLQKKVWEKIKESELDNSPPSGNLPVSFNSVVEESGQKVIELTEEEAFDIYSAKLANSFWLDMNNIVPWKLADYDKENLAELLLPKTWFSKWDTEDHHYEMKGLVDYSPRKIFSILDKIVDLDVIKRMDDTAAKKDIIFRIINDLHSFKHVSVGDLTSINTIEGMYKEKISRSGCQTMAPFFVHLLNTLNIPARTEFNSYLDGNNHRAAVIESLDYYLPHGDDFYNAYITNTPANLFLNSYSFWKENIFTEKKEDFDKDYLRYKVNLHNITNALRFPSRTMMEGYCYNGGIDFLDLVFDLWTTEEELNNFAERIDTITDNCTHISENDPLLYFVDMKSKLNIK